jgi:multiple sugar transport system substrate-binding protein
MAVRVRAVRMGALAVGVAMATMVAGCASSGSTGSTGSTGSGGSGAAAGPVHPDIHVTWHQVASGSKGGYTKMLTATKAGNGPCLAQVGYETLPSFAAAGALQDVSSYASGSSGQFAGWAWNQVSIQGSVYGIPVDTAPMALIYRKDLFAKYGITAPPVTWAQYAADAAKVHAADPSVYLGSFGNDAYNYAGLDWQAGGQWFGTANNQWQVTIDSAANQKVASFWQGLLDGKLLKPDPSYDPSLYKDMSDGKVLSDVNAVWDTPIVATSVSAATSGKWAVAPMPVWNAAQPVYGNDGGSATAVLKGCTHAKEATEFAVWMSTDQASLTNLIKVTGIYPAATAGLTNPELSAPDAFYGGQKIFDVFRAETPDINTSWQWGPTMTQTSGDIADGLGAAEQGGKTLAAVLSGTQADTVAQLKSQGLSVSG